MLNSEGCINCSLQRGRTGHGFFWGVSILSALVRTCYFIYSVNVYLSFPFYLLPCLAYQILVFFIPPVQHLLTDKFALLYLLTNFYYAIFIVGEYSFFSKKNVSASLVGIERNEWCQTPMGSRRNYPPVVHDPTPLVFNSSVYQSLLMTMCYKWFFKQVSQVPQQLTMRQHGEQWTQYKAWPFSHPVVDDNAERSAF